MKTLIVSDIHLTHIFDEKKYLFLEKLFSSCEKIILNGDFWDGYRTTFDHFVSSRWNKLFPLLKSKGTIYLYGNHDQKQFSDERTSLFSIEQKDSHILELNSTIYHIEHGHLLYPTIDMTFPFSRQLLNHVNIIFHNMERMFVTLGSHHDIILRQTNQIIKKKLEIKRFSHWYLCGHTHFAEFDSDSKFVNSGFIQFGKASYLIADSSGLSLWTEWYK